jgi:nucleoside-triphosphatase THEP1
VLDVQSGQKRCLTLPPDDPRAAASVVQGRFRFDPAVLAWGNEAIARAAAGHPDLLVVDELGPLELARGAGWAAALTVLQRPDYQAALVVVRPELIEAVQRRLPPHTTTIVAVTVENRDRLPELLLGPISVGLRSSYPTG